MSVSNLWVPVAPSTKVGYTVSLVELFATAVILVASVAVAAFPVQLPELPLASPVTLPVNVPMNPVAVIFPVDGLYVQVPSDS